MYKNFPFRSPIQRKCSQFGLFWRSRAEEGSPTFQEMSTILFDFFLSFSSIYCLETHIQPHEEEGNEITDRGRFLVTSIGWKLLHGKKIRAVSSGPMYASQGKQGEEIEGWWKQLKISAPSHTHIHARASEGKEEDEIWQEMHILPIDQAFGCCADQTPPRSGRCRNQAFEGDDHHCQTAPDLLRERQVCPLFPTNGDSKSDKKQATRQRWSWDKICIG